jgi:hypothetical protein
MEASGGCSRKINFRHVNCNVVGVLYAQTDQKKNNCDGVGVSMKHESHWSCCTHIKNETVDHAGGCVEKRVTQIMLYAQLNVRHVMRVWVRRRERVAPFVLYAQ